MRILIVLSQILIRSHLQQNKHIKGGSIIMKIWKLVSGILSIIFFALVAMQSCAVGVANTLEDSGEVSSSAGNLVRMVSDQRSSCCCSTGA